MSSAFTFDVTIDTHEAEEMLQYMALYLPRHIKQWLVQAAELTKRTEMERAPEGIGAVMGQGIKNNIDIDYDGLKARIAPNHNVPYAIYVEEGTPPHRPPTFPNSSLAQWAELKGLNVFAVAKSIEKKGTKAHPFVSETYAAVSPGINRIFDRGVSTFMGGLA